MFFVILLSVHDKPSRLAKPADLARPARLAGLKDVRDLIIVLAILVEDVSHIT